MTSEEEFEKGRWAGKGNGLWIITLAIIESKIATLVGLLSTMCFSGIN